MKGEEGNGEEEKRKKLRRLKMASPGTYSRNGYEDSLRFSGYDDAGSS